MCGIVGILMSGAENSALVSEEILRTMADAIRHRGPDAGGTWLDVELGIGLAHRRLSILDLSAAGAQPMHSHCGRFVIAFNGEIYNHKRIRSNLKSEGRAPAWRGHSDTETLLAAISAWGFQSAIQHCYGMFALALWDRTRSRVILARDRVGEKPLYLARSDRGWFFASELKALRAFSHFSAVVNERAVMSFLTFGYVPDQQCIYQQVFKVPPGYFIEIEPGSRNARPKPYFSFESAINGRRNRHRNCLARGEGNPIENMEAQLREVIDEQMQSDVSLGCFLSGGIDSSLVASLMQSRSEIPIKTFSIGFDDRRLNETPFSLKIANHLNTDHIEYVLSEDEALDLIPELPMIYDEPFADSSQIPTAILCHKAKKSITVALTGDGGDEVFGGYNRHIWGPKLFKFSRKIPHWLLKVGANGVNFVDKSLIFKDILYKSAGRLHLPINSIGKGSKVMDALINSSTMSDFYSNILCVNSNALEICTTQKFTEKLYSKLDNTKDRSDSEWMMAMDIHNYLVGDLLVKLDRASMKYSLETRMPYLDIRVIEAAWRLPLELRIRGNCGKVILRKILERHIPRKFFERPKQGFAVPIDRWLRGGLYAWAESLLTREDLISLAGLDFGKLDMLWQAHQSGRVNRGEQLWTVLMLLAWLEKSRDTCLGRSGTLVMAK